MRNPRAGVVARAAPTMADPMHQARVDALMQKFMDADHDGNGVIDKQELRALLESVGGEAPSQHWLGDDEVEAIFHLYDHDGNGTISFDEFVHLAEDGVLLEGKLHEYEVVFNALDTDNDGTLSATEIKAAMRQLGAPDFTMSRVREILSEYDKVPEDISTMKALVCLHHRMATVRLTFTSFCACFEASCSTCTTSSSFWGCRLRRGSVQPRTSSPSRGSLSRFVACQFFSSIACFQAPECKPGTITNLFSAAELESVLHRHARDNKLIVVMAGMTFCSACKAFVPSYLVCWSTLLQVFNHMIPSETGQGT